MTRRNRKGNRDQDLALALSRVEAAFGPVRVLEVRPNPRPAAKHHPVGSEAGDEAAQTVLDLDSPTDGEGGEAVA